jgi:hypothetical protein
MGQFANNLTRPAKARLKPDVRCYSTMLHAEDR